MSNNLVTVRSYDTLGTRGPNLPKFAKLSKMNEWNFQWISKHLLRCLNFEWSFPDFVYIPITPQTTTTTLTWKVSLPAKISTWPSGHSAYTAPVGSRTESRDPPCVSGRWQPDSRTWHTDREQVGSHTCSDETEKSNTIRFTLLTYMFGTLT